MSRCRSFALLGVMPAVMLGALLGCGAPRGSMIEYAALRDARGARLYTDGSTLVMTTSDPIGGALVTYEPRLEGDHIVLNGGVTSSGAARERWHCFDVAALAPPAGWTDRVAWREPDGTLVPVGPIERGEAAAVALVHCEPHEGSR